MILNVNKLFSFSDKTVYVNFLSHLLVCKTEQYSHIVLYIYIDVKEINELLITNVLPHGMDIFLTNRGKPGIKYDGFQYRLEKETSVSKLWQCVQKTWPARCKTDLQELIVLGGRFDHCHDEPNQRNIENQKVRTECKRKAEEEPYERPCKLIIQESRGGTMWEAVYTDHTRNWKAKPDRNTT
jgi:hypothetical protein